MVTDLAFIGCLTTPTPYFPQARGNGIRACRFDSETGELMPIAECSGIENPTWLTLDRVGARLFACSEVFEWEEGAVTAFAVTAHGDLSRISDRLSQGSITAYASLDRSERFLLVANYGLDAPHRRREYGIVVLPVGHGGMLGPGSSRLSHNHLPCGPNRARQERSHAHAVLPSPDNRFILATDLGIDRVLAYRFDATSGAVDPTPATSLAMQPGAGPRHLAFHPNGRRLYVINELDSTVAVLAFDAMNSELTLVQSVSTLPAGFAGASDACALAVLPNGCFLYATNRGHDSIAVFAIDAARGVLDARGHVPCGGRTPRCLTIHPQGQFALVANQNSDNVTAFRIDPATGALEIAGSPFAVGTPMSIVFRPTTPN
jgi:6-phosphogluconolactonase